MPFEKGNSLGRKFKAGESANPGGRPKVATEARKKAQEHTAEALEVLLTAMRAAEKTSERISAAVKVLQVAGIPMGEERGAAVDPQPGQPKPTAEMTPEALEAAAAAGEA
jgi:hypothetical protein